MAYTDKDHVCELSIIQGFFKAVLGADFSIPASQAVSLINELAWLTGIRKSEENLLKTSRILKACSFLTNVAPIIFYDVTTVGNNRQVRVNFGVKLQMKLLYSILPKTPNKVQKTQNWQLILENNLMVQGWKLARISLEPNELVSSGFQIKIWSQLPWGQPTSEIKLPPRKFTCPSFCAFSCDYFFISKDV